MGQTISEKILSRASGRKGVSPGEIVKANVDILMVNDVTAPPAFEAFEQMGFKKVWDVDKVVVGLDHVVPACDIKSATLNKAVRDFVIKQGIKHFYDVGRGGICHQIMQEKGLVWPGMVLVGADSHTCTSGALGAFCVGVGQSDAAAVLGTGRLWFRVPDTFRFEVEGALKSPVMSKDLILQIIGQVGADGAVYKALEFAGPAFERMSIGERMTVANMSIEASAKTGIVEPDRKVSDYLKTRFNIQVPLVKSDKDAHFEKKWTLDASKVEPKVAVPFRVDNVKNVSEVEGTEVNQAFVGSCTNGRIEDLRMAAKIVDGRKVHERVRFIVAPASMEVYSQALSEGLLSKFIEADAIICGPSCAACPGMSNGILALGEVCISSSNRNFLSRMGHKDSKVYLASPATVAASAVKGKITDPRVFA